MKYFKILLTAMAWTGMQMILFSCQNVAHSPKEPSAFNQSTHLLKKLNWSNESSLLFEYNQERLLTRKTERTRGMSDKVWTFEYNSRQQLSKATLKNVLEIRCVYAEGRLFRAEEYKKDGKLKAFHQFSYNGKGQRFSQVSYLKTLGKEEAIPYEKIEYAYDEFRNLIRVQKFNYNFENSLFELNETITYDDFEGFHQTGDFGLIPTVFFNPVEQMYQRGPGKMVIRHQKTKPLMYQITYKYDKKGIPKGLNIEVSGGARFHLEGKYEYL